MQKGHLLQFACPSCQGSVEFSVFALEQNEKAVCPTCHKTYNFNDETLKRQLRKFSALCAQLIDSEEILSHTAVGIDVGEHHVKVPFKLLLTRFNSCLELEVGDQPVTIYFRIEPLKDISALEKESHHEPIR